MHDVDNKGHTYATTSTASSSKPVRTFAKAKNPEYYNVSNWELYDIRLTPQWPDILQQYKKLDKAKKTDVPIKLGFSGVVKGGNHLYFIPYSEQTDLNHGIHLQYDLTQDFMEPTSWKMFDTRAAFGDSPVNYTGFLGAAVYGNYIYYAPMEGLGQKAQSTSTFVFFFFLFFALLGSRTIGSNLNFTNSAKIRHDSAIRRYSVVGASNSS